MIVDCAIYEEGKRRDGHVDLEHAYDERHQPGKFVWIGLYEPTEEEFASLRREFNLHPLAVEDAIHAHQRPKLEVYEDMLFIVLKTARYVDPNEVIELGELLVFLGDDFIITVRHGEASSLKPVREELENDPKHLRRGPGAVLHAILDRVVDDYQPAIEGLETDIDEVEEELFSAGRSNPAERIYRLQREVLGFRKATAPLVEPVARLAEGKYAHDPPGDPRLLPRRQRSPDARARPARRDARPPRQLASGQPGPGVRAPERRRPAHLRLGRDRRGADGDRGHLRHELRAHAGAEMGGRLPGRPAPDAGRSAAFLYYRFKRAGWL